MAIIFIPDEILEKLKSGEILFSDLDDIELSEGIAEENQQEIEVQVVYSKVAINLNLRWEVMERDNFTCKKCGARRFLHVDHIYPESKGGEATLDNLQTLCRRCNISKGAKVV